MEEKDKELLKDEAFLAFLKENNFLKSEPPAPPTPPAPPIETLSKTEIMRIVEDAIKANSNILEKQKSKGVPNNAEVFI